MDQVAQAFYELKFLTAFSLKRGNEFQDFFADIMEKAHPEDFMRVRPWGAVGDRKCDGYLRSQRLLFQVYAPNELSASVAIAKIDADFIGAVPFWGEHFDSWVFVHNSEQGLGPDVTRKLLELEAAHQIGIGHWGREELRRKVFQLSDSDVASLLGPAPTLRDMLDLGLEVLAPVLDQVATIPVPADLDLRPPPANKIARNMLSQHVETLLKAGMTRVDLVKKCFGVRPESRDEVAQSFRTQYETLRNQGMSPDQVFVALQRHAGGEAIPNPSKQSAVLAVLAFFFEECEIFERDGGGDS